MPLTEKNAPQEATKIALSPNNAVNKLTYCLHHLQPQGNFSGRLANIKAWAWVRVGIFYQK